MDQHLKPSARIAPLPPEHSPDSKTNLRGCERILGSFPTAFSSCSANPKWRRHLRK
jgi:hypothetical protein